jgi:hypothetical protein
MVRNSNPRVTLFGKKAFKVLAYGSENAAIGM